MLKDIDQAKIDAEINELVIERMKLFPSDKNISIGQDGNFTKDQIISHVKKNDEIGKKIVEIELSYLKAFKKGIFFDE
ncbi:MAG: hypothetical protein UR98_C0022G0011 [Parcubacteria group bacterium GW2011_GWA1_36_12]|nr:MAG: hypothetical protein UR98_C0022G0011 [Parcubacteria group bacterium GW2011_GWA1_36_12]